MPSLASHVRMSCPEISQHMRTELWEVFQASQSQLANQQGQLYRSDAEHEHHCATRSSCFSFCVSLGRTRFLPPGHVVAAVAGTGSLGAQLFIPRRRISFLGRWQTAFLHTRNTAKRP